MKKTQLQQKIRELGFALADQELRRQRTADYLGQRLLHKILPEKLYKTEKRA